MRGERGGSVDHDWCPDTEWALAAPAHTGRRRLSLTAARRGDNPWRSRSRAHAFRGWTGLITSL